MIKNHLVDKQLSVGQEAKLVDRISGSLRDSGKKEQERQTKVIFSIEQNQNSNTIEPFYILFSSLTYETTLMAGLIVCWRLPT